MYLFQLLVYEEKSIIQVISPFYVVFSFKRFIRFQLNKKIYRNFKIFTKFYLTGYCNSYPYRNSDSRERLIRRRVTMLKL